MATLQEILNNRDYMLDLCVRMAHHSTAIEGNTLSQDETASIILDNFLNLKANEREFYEVRNYRFVLPVLIDSLTNKELLDNELIKKFHSVIMRDLRDDAGQFKKIENLVVGANFEPTKPYLVPSALKDWCDNLDYQLKNATNSKEKVEAILYSHASFEKIHPFGDGNGRTGRLLMVYSCFQNNLPPLVIPKEQKAKYISFLRGADMKEFVCFARELQVVEQKRMDKFLQQIKTYDKGKDPER